MRPSRTGAKPAFVVSCLVVFAAQMWLSAAGESQTFDEADHIHSGFVAWTNSDYGTNPEHPPLVKLVAAAPLLSLHLKPPPVPNGFFRVAGFIGGYRLLYLNDADKLLFRARVAVGVFAVALALLVFLAGSEMLGFAAGACALILFIFEPNLLAHGGLVGTDVGLTCCMFGTVYALYRFAKRPSIFRLAVWGLATGLTLGPKHSGILVVPIMLLLIASNIVIDQQSGQNLWREILNWAGRLAVVAGIVVLVLWSLYGFRYRARPGNLDLNPPFAAYIRSLPDPAVQHTLEALAKWRVLPEAYLYGIAAITIDSKVGRPVTFLGKHYTNGQWFYFPVVFLVKSTLAFLCLLLITAASWKIWRAWSRRELIFILLPAVVYFLFCVNSKLNLGIRHLLPVFPFFIVLAGAGAAALLARSRAWAVAAAALLVFHAGSSLYAYPAYTSYANEAWGGPNATWSYLNDSNVGYFAGLKEVARYVHANHISDCWILAGGPVDPRYYGIPCKPLPALWTRLTNVPVPAAPPEIDGVVIVSAGNINADPWLTPDHPIHPVAVLRGEQLVLNGHFAVPKLSAISHLERANFLLGKHALPEALTEAQTAAVVDPESVNALVQCGSILKMQKKSAEAHGYFQQAAAMAKQQKLGQGAMAAIEQAAR